MLWLAFLTLLLGFQGRFRKSAREVIRFIPDCLVLFKRLLKDHRVARRAKVALGLMLAYLAMPFDLVPDFIPVVGQLDDVVLVLAVVGYVVHVSGEEVVRELWPGTDRGLNAVLALAA